MRRRLHDEKTTWGGDYMERELHDEGTRKSRLASVLTCGNHGVGKSYLTSNLAIWVTADGNSTWPPSSAAHTCPWGCNIAFSARHKNPQVSSLMSLIITSFTRQLTRRLVHRLHNRFFPSLHPFMYNKHIFTLDSATSMYAIGRPSNVYFLTARGSFALDDGALWRRPLIFVYSQIRCQWGRLSDRGRLLLFVFL